MRLEGESDARNVATRLMLEVEVILRAHDREPGLRQNAVSLFSSKCWYSAPKVTSTSGPLYTSIRSRRPRTSRGSKYDRWH